MKSNNHIRKLFLQPSIFQGQCLCLAIEIIFAIFTQIKPRVFLPGFRFWNMLQISSKLKSTPRWSDLHLSWVEELVRKPTALNITLSALGKIYMYISSGNFWFRSAEITLSGLDQVASNVLLLFRFAIFSIWVHLMRYTYHIILINMKSCDHLNWKWLMKGYIISKQLMLIHFRSKRIKGVPPYFPRLPFFRISGCPLPPRNHVTPVTRENGHLMTLGPAETSQTCQGQVSRAMHLVT